MGLSPKVTGLVLTALLFIRMCGHRLRDQYIQHWNGAFRDSSACLLYRELKGDLVVLNI